MKKRPALIPDIVEKDENEIKKIISQINSSALSDDEKHFIVKCIELALWLPLFLQKKSITLHRLRTMLFGKGYNKKNKQELVASTPPSIPDEATTTSSAVDKNIPSLNSQDISVTSENEGANTPLVAVNGDGDAEKKKGHGRMPHTVYTDCTEVNLLLNLTAGDSCPTLCGGKLSIYKPGIIVRVKGQNFANAYRFYVAKLRCSSCNIIISADIPPEVGNEKYDESFKAMLALMKYYIAVPFYRQEQFQRMLNFPLSDSTQWHLIEILASACYPVFNLLKTLAANGRLLHNDDTKLRILDVIKLLKESKEEDRKGMYTTGIIADYEGHQIALFINGRQHSGENVKDILLQREPEKEPIIQMCDALSANVPTTMKTILCNCLSHGFRKFEEIADYFENECPIIIKLLSQVFKHDEQTRDMSPEERLLYHQKNSKSIMDELENYMANLMREHRIEPNSDLGCAIKYMQRHWHKLTRFLTVAGAPIDNNIVERALKIAIRNRKSSMFYRSTYSASIGGMITSLIYTCHLANENPHDYLIALQKHQPDVSKNTVQWLPWTYRKTIEDHLTNQDKQGDANSQEYLLPSDRLVVT